MIEAAYRLMSTRGYSQTTLADVAQEAGVAVQTVYFTFHNKPALMRAAFEFAVHGDHRSVGPARQPWFEAMRNEADLHKALAMFVEANTAILRRIAPLVSIFQALANDPEITVFHQLSEQRRREGYRMVIATLTEKRPLRPDLSPEDATSILLALSGSDVYRTMVAEAGWSEAKWCSWAVRTLSETLFGVGAMGPKQGSEPA